MKGFYFSGITFVAVFILAASAAFFFSTAVQDSNRGIVREAQTSALITDVESDLLRFTSTVYEVVANSTENNRTQLERNASRALQATWNVSADVVFSNASNGNTNVTLVFRNYSLNNSATVINLTGQRYSTIIGHGFFHFSHIYETYNSSELCSYADFNPESPDYCSVNYSGFAADKRTQTGFAWLVNITGGDCEERSINYTVRLVDTGDLATAVNPFQLRVRDGGVQHTASC